MGQKSTYFGNNRLYYSQLLAKTSEKVFNIIRISSLRAEATAIFQNFQNKFFDLKIFKS